MNFNLDKVFNFSKQKLTGQS